MKKWRLFLVVVLLLAGLTSCSYNPLADAPTSAAAEEPANGEHIYSMQIGHAQPISHPRHQSLIYFKAILEQRTEGAIQVEIFPMGQLGSEASMLDEVCSGSIQGFRGGQLEIVPKMLIFTLPFLFENREEAERLMSSDFAMMIGEESKESGATILGISDAGDFRQLSSNVKVIRSPEDLAGLKMRSNGMDTMSRTLAALGAEVVTIPYNDLYMAAKTGVIDGQENSWANVSEMRFYEVQKYFTKIDYQFHPEPFYVNTEWYEALPEEYQEILVECTQLMMKRNMELIEQGEKLHLENIKKNAEVYELTKEERQAFVEATQTVYDQYLEEGLLTRQELDTMRRIIKGEE